MLRNMVKRNEEAPNIELMDATSCLCSLPLLLGVLMRVFTEFYFKSIVFIRILNLY